MVKRVPPTDLDIVIKFGNGLNSYDTEDSIDDREAAGGFNFELGIEQGGHSGKPKELRPRHPFDLVATAPNAAEIRGGGSFIDANGAVKAFFQAGNTVYEFDGSSFQASPVLDTVNASAKLRCHWRSHTWHLDGKGIITDMALLEPVMEWNGTTWKDVDFLSGVCTSFGTFRAKYLTIANERAIFGNVQDATGALPHLIVGSKRGDYETISVSDRPSSALNDEDPFFIPTPDLKDINGLIEAFRAVIISTEKGKIFNLSGESAQDFTIEDYFEGSAASGEESMAFAGNDVIYGRQGRIESIRNIDQFGNTDADDLTRKIADIVRAYTGWRVVYNSRLNRVYAFPTGESEVWVIDTSGLANMRDGGPSQWMRWTTKHSLAFQPTFVMSMLDPADGLEYVFMGDSSGNVFRLEGTSHNGDADENTIQTEYLTKLYAIPLDADAYDLEGYIRYRKDEAAEVQLIFEYAGKAIFTHPVTVELPSVTGVPYWGTWYWSDGTYWRTIRGKLSRQKFDPAGGSNEFQLRVRVDSASNFAIPEIGLRFKAASQ